MTTQCASVADYYAYIGERAISDYENGLVLKEEDFPDGHLVCELFAQAGRSALQAMSIRASIAVRHDGIHLLAQLDALRRSCSLAAKVLKGEKLDDAARLLSRTLLLTGCRAGVDFVMRDLFDRSTVETCHEAAHRLVDAMTRHLLGLSLETVETRFHRFRKSPMTNAEFWCRRRQSMTHQRR